MQDKERLCLLRSSVWLEPAENLAQNHDPGIKKKMYPIDPW